MFSVIRYMFCIFLCLSLLFSACAVSRESGAADASMPQASGTEDAGSPLPLAYADILEHLINAYPWNKDDLTMVPEHPELSYLYHRNPTLSEIGFSLMDLDGNGQLELILGEISTNLVYDVYTLSNSEAVQLLSSGERFTHSLYENGYVENVWSSSAAQSGHDFYQLRDGSLCLVERITVDAFHALNAGVIDELSEADGENCFFRSTSEQEADYQHITSQEAVEAIEGYQNANNPLQIEYTSLSEYTINED